MRPGAPITCVSQQLRHKDASITLRVHAHWVPDASAVKAVDLLDDAQPSATDAAIARTAKHGKSLAREW